MTFNDSDLSELLAAHQAGEMTDTTRTSLEWILNQLIEAEATAVIGARPHERFSRSFGTTSSSRYSTHSVSAACHAWLRALDNPSPSPCTTRNRWCPPARRAAPGSGGAESSTTTTSK